jgi:hypothetical protein
MIPALERILDAIGYLQTLVFLVGIVVVIVVFARGILPALWRLGNGLAKRKIAIFAKGDNLPSLRALLLDSKLFKAKNIVDIANEQDIERAQMASLYLVFWHDWSDHIDQILIQKPNQCPLIVYSPYDREKIPPDEMRKLDGKRHTAVTNFRGRLLNDIVSSMITTSYEEK